jgi:hypothetical protein
MFGFYHILELPYFVIQVAHFSWNKYFANFCHTLWLSNSQTHFCGYHTCQTKARGHTERWQEGETEHELRLAPPPHRFFPLPWWWPTGASLGFHGGAISGERSGGGIGVWSWSSGRVVGVWGVGGVCISLTVLVRFLCFQEFLAMRGVREGELG